MDHNSPLTITNLQTVDKEIKRRIDVLPKMHLYVTFSRRCDDAMHGTDGGFDQKRWKAMRTRVLELALAKAGLAGTKASWNWKGGCSCGCSPCFIVDFRSDYDIFVDVDFA